ncbi:MAG: sigma-70 family RNA polymerase sigma factor [Chloroflexi bacterium]|nr:sigma-70 family RNA polymerase sigma factor [Chloroflexota bacterium]MBI3740419.1 sigma-70 family RNA polymerase sigma factor [Chloroflexota bacterium]
MNNSTPSDVELILLVARNEAWALAEIYNRYARLVFSLAVRILNDRAGAEEVVQEVFVKVWRRARDYDVDRGKFSSWLSGIAHHHAIDELRRRRVRPSATQNDEEEAVNIPDDGPALLEIAIQSLEHRRIVDALKIIPLEQRRAIEMAYFEGYTQQEIANLLHQPLGTIKTRMRLGMQKLKLLLGEQ